MSIINIGVCDALTQDYVDALRNKNLIRVTDFVSTASEELSSKTGIPFTVIKSVKKALLAKFCAFPQSGADLYSHVVSSSAILSTGVTRVDNLLDGGLYTGEVTEIVGGVAVGKTQLCFGASVTTASQPHQHVMYIDTGHVVNAKRLHQMFQARDQEESQINEKMKRIHICQAYTLDELFSTLSKIKSQILTNSGFYPELKLVIIDNIASVIYPILGGGSYVETQSLLNSLGNLLKDIAVSCSVAVLVTNNVVSDNRGVKTASLGRTWSHVPHIRVMMDSTQESSKGHKTLKILKSSRGPVNAEGMFYLSDIGSTS